MFGSIGGPEVILLFIAALLLFGPRRLPEIARTLGKAVADFRRATNEFKINLEREVQLEEIKAVIRPIENAPRPAALARGVLDVTLSEPKAEAQTSTTPHDKTAIDGGPGSIH